MFWLGSLMSQVLQWTQFCAFICNLIPSPVSMGTYSYTPGWMNKNRNSFSHCVNLHWTACKSCDLPVNGTQGLKKVKAHNLDLSVCVKARGADNQSSQVPSLNQALQCWMGLVMCSHPRMFYSHTAYRYTPHTAAILPSSLLLKAICTKPNFKITTAAQLLLLSKMNPSGNIM